MREAARRANLSEITWRNYESGIKLLAKGVSAPVNPRDDKLEAAAKAVGLDPAVVFEIAGRPYDGALSPAPAADGPPAALSGKIGRLSERDRRAVERLVDEMLGPE
jgi:hypothetical protein